MNNKRQMFFLPESFAAISRALARASAAAFDMISKISATVATKGDCLCCQVMPVRKKTENKIIDWLAADQ